MRAINIAWVVDMPVPLSNAVPPVHRRLRAIPVGLQLFTEVVPFVHVSDYKRVSATCSVQSFACRKDGDPQSPMLKHCGQAAGSWQQVP